jgi:hypothetical protein
MANSSECDNETSGYIFDRSSYCHVISKASVT